MKIGTISARQAPGSTRASLLQGSEGGGLVLTLASLLLWIGSVQAINVRDMTDLGLVSVLPLPVFVALAMLIVGFCLTLRSKQPNERLLALQIIVLIFMLYGITALVEERPRFAVAWLHVGFAEHIMRTGGLAPELDARFSWPLFFALSAFLTKIAGFQSALSFVSWAPVYFNLLYLGPLVLILNSATPDKRLIWLGVWFFYLTNWIGQDYFSPQAFNYFLYLVIVAIILRWFEVPTTQLKQLGPDWERLRAVANLENTFSGPRQRAGLFVVIVVLYAVVVSSHQLTPFFTLVAVGALVLFRRCSLRALPLLMAVMTGGWIIFMTVAFLSGHINSLLENIGRIGGAVNENVTGRLQGSPEHILIIYLRMLMTLAIWGLAVLGGLRRLIKGYRDVAFALLAAAPFPLLALQAYGGEMVLRIYLFALPFMVFGAAVLFLPTPIVRVSGRTLIVICLTSVGLLVGFLFSRYGNERMDYMSSYDVEAVQHLYQIAEPGAALVSVASNLPWRYQGVEKYEYLPLTDEVLIGDLERLMEILSDPRYPGAYLILTRSQKAYAELFKGVQPGEWERFEASLAHVPNLKLIFANEDAKIFAFERER